MNIEHIAIWTQDISRLRSFYEKYFGARSNPLYTNQRNRFQSYFLSFESGARLELMQRPGILGSDRSSGQEFTGYAHLAVSVGSEERVDALARQLAEDGRKILDGPRRTGDGYYECTVLDPDGNRIEITV